MAPMARTEPAAKVTRLSNGYTSQVRADTEHDEPFGLLDAIAIGLRISERFPLYGLGFLDLVGGAVADEDGLATPFDDYLWGEGVSDGERFGWKEVGGWLIRGRRG